MTRPDTGPREPGRITSVTGGVGGLEATYDVVRGLAATYDATGDLLRDWAARTARVLLDPDLVTSAPLSPLTFAEAEHAVLSATTGGDGLLVESCGWEADALAIRAALAALELADDSAHLALDELDRRLGFLAGTALRAVGPTLAPVLLVGSHELSPELRARLDGEVESWLVAHPGLVQHAFNGSGGLLSGLLGANAAFRDEASGARALGRWYDDGTPRATVRPDLAVPSGDHQPDSLAALVDHLREVAALSPDPDSPGNGTIEIQTYDAGSDHARHVVYLPGTDDLTTLPWQQDQDLRDAGTNFRNIGGESTAYERGILDAMAQAHIGPGEPVLLVGHSQGGMAAAALLSRGSDFAVTNVVTAGSPTAQVDGFPSGSHVLSLEHRGDIVPLTDGAPNPDSREQVTVTFEDGGSGLVDRHGYPHYLAGAAAIDASTDRATVEQLDSLRGHGFLATPGAGAPTISSQVFQIVRER